MNNSNSRRAKAAIAPQYQLENPDMHDTLCRVAMVVYHHIKLGEQQAWSKYKCKGVWEPGRAPRIEQSLSDLDPELERTIGLIAQVASGGPRAEKALNKLMRARDDEAAMDSPQGPLPQGVSRGGQGVVVLSPRTHASSVSEATAGARSSARSRHISPRAASARYSSSGRYHTAAQSAHDDTEAAMPDLRLGDGGSDDDGNGIKSAAGSALHGSDNLSAILIPSTAAMRAPLRQQAPAVWSARAGGMQSQGTTEEQPVVGSLQQSSWYGPALLQAARATDAVGVTSGSTTGASFDPSVDMLAPGSGSSRLGVPLPPSSGNNHEYTQGRTSSHLRPVDTMHGLAAQPKPLQRRGSKSSRPRPLTRAAKQGQARRESGLARAEQARDANAPHSNDFRPAAPLPERVGSILDDNFGRLLPLLAGTRDAMHEPPEAIGSRVQDPLVPPQSNDDTADGTGGALVPQAQAAGLLSSFGPSSPGNTSVHKRDSAFASRGHGTGSTRQDRMLAALGPESELDVSLQSAGNTEMDEDVVRSTGTGVGMAALTPVRDTQGRRTQDTELDLEGQLLSGAAKVGAPDNVAAQSGFVDAMLGDSASAASEFDSQVDGSVLSPGVDEGPRSRDQGQGQSNGSWLGRALASIFCCRCCRISGSFSSRSEDRGIATTSSGRLHHSHRRKRHRRRPKEDEGGSGDGFQSDSTNDSWVHGKYAAVDSVWSEPGDTMTMIGSHAGPGLDATPGGDRRGGVVVGGVGGTPFQLARSQSLLRQRGRRRGRIHSESKRPGLVKAAGNNGLIHPRGAIHESPLESPSAAALERWWGPDDPWARLPAETLSFHERNYLVPCYRYVLAPSHGVLLGGAGAHAVQRIRRRWAVPSPGEIFAFAARLCLLAQLTPECPIVSLVYLERVLQSSGGRVLMLSCTWRPLVAGCLLLASKVWQDLSTWNAEVAGILGLYPLPEMNLLERRLVAALRFRLFVAPRSYAQAYFGLRSLGERARFRKSKFRAFLAAALPEGYGHGVGSGGNAGGGGGGGHGAAGDGHGRGNGGEHEERKEARDGDTRERGRGGSFAGNAEAGWGDSSVLTAPIRVGALHVGAKHGMQQAGLAPGLADTSGSVGGGSVQDNVVLGYTGKGLRGWAYREQEEDIGGNREDVEHSERLDIENTSVQSGFMGAWGPTGGAATSSERGSSIGQGKRQGEGQRHGQAGSGAIAISRGAQRTSAQRTVAGAQSGAAGQDLLAEASFGSAQIRGLGLGVSRGMESFDFAHGPLARRESGRSLTPTKHDASGGGGGGIGAPSVIATREEGLGLSTTAPVRPPTWLIPARPVSSARAGVGGTGGVQAGAGGGATGGTFGSLPRRPNTQFE